MSTKLHHGYKLTGLGDMLGLQAWWRAMFVKLEDVQEAEAAKMLASEAIRFFDKDTLGLPRPHPKESPVFAATLDISDRVKKIEREGTRDPRRDFSFSVSVIPVGEQLLALLFTENEALQKTFASAPEVAPFPYWNHSDRPKKVTEAEWEERRRLWDEALAGSGIPSANGFTLELRDVIIFGTSIEGFVCPTPEVRAREHAVNAVLGRRIRPMVKKCQAAKERVASHEVMEALRWVERDEEGQAVVAAEVAIVAAKLKPEITLEDLRAEPSRRGKAEAAG